MESSSLTGSRIIRLKSGIDPVRNGQMVSLQSLWLTLVVLGEKIKIIIWSGNPVLTRPEALLLQLLGRTKPWVAGKEPAKEEWTPRNFPSASSGTRYLSPQPYITPPPPPQSQRSCVYVGVCANPAATTSKGDIHERTSEGGRASAIKWGKESEWV